MTEAERRTVELVRAADRLTANCWDTYLAGEPDDRKWDEVFDRVLEDGRAVARAWLAERPAAAAPAAAPTDDEVRLAAATILVTPATAAAWAAEPGRLIPLAYRLARAWVAVHPTDDDQPTTEDWWLSCGLVREWATDYTVKLSNLRDALDDDRAGWVEVQIGREPTRVRVVASQTIADGGITLVSPTRGCARATCRALGVKLKGQP